MASIVACILSFLTFTTPVPQVSVDMGAGRYRPLTPTTLFPSLLARISLISYNVCLFIFLMFNYWKLDETD